MWLEAPGCRRLCRLDDRGHVTAYDTYQLANRFPAGECSASVRRVASPFAEPAPVSRVAIAALVRRAPDENSWIEDDGVDAADAERRALMHCFESPRLLHAGDVFTCESGVYVVLNLEAAAERSRPTYGIVSTAKSTMVLTTSSWRTRVPPRRDWPAMAPPLASVPPSTAFDDGDDSGVRDGEVVECSVPLKSSAAPPARATISQAVQDRIIAALRRQQPPDARGGAVTAEVPSVLVCGVSGSGKRVAAARAAERLGCVLVEIDGALLAARHHARAADGIETALRATIDRATQAAGGPGAGNGGPRVLVHLRRCDALLELEGSAAEGSGSSSDPPPTHPRAVRAEQVRRAIGRCLADWQGIGGSQRTEWLHGNREDAAVSGSNSKGHGQHAPLMWERVELPSLEAAETLTTSTPDVSLDPGSGVAPPAMHALTNNASPPSSSLVSQADGSPAHAAVNNIMFCSARVPAASLPLAFTTALGATVECPTLGPRGVVGVLRRALMDAHADVSDRSVKDALLRLAGGILRGCSAGAARSFAAFIIDAALLRAAVETTDECATTTVRRSTAPARFYITAGDVAAAAQRWEMAQPDRWDAPRVPEGVTFEDVGAAAEARQELADLVRFVSRCDVNCGLTWRSCTLTCCWQSTSCSTQ